MFRIFGPEAREILAARPRTDPVPPSMQGRALSAGPPGSPCLPGVSGNLDEVICRYSAMLGRRGETCSGQSKSQNIPDSSQGITAMIRHPRPQPGVLRFLPFPDWAGDALCTYSTRRPPASQPLCHQHRLTPRISPPSWDHRGGPLRPALGP